MISLEECRKADKRLEQVSDEDLTVLRNSLYELGNIAFKTWQNEKFPNISHGLLQINNNGSKITKHE